MSYKDTIKEIIEAEQVREAKEERKEESNQDNSLPITDIEKEEIEPIKKELRRKLWQTSWQIKKGASVEAIERIYKQNSKAIKKLAYIIHDKDKKEDGTPKEPHIHIVLACNYSVAVSTVANWFGFENYNMIQLCKGKDSYNDILLYFTHKAYKNNIQKMHYEIGDIRQLGEQTDIEEIVTNKLECKNPKKKQSLLQSLKEKLLNGEISYPYIRKNFPDFFVNNVKRFKEINQERIDLLPIPDERINFYITGAGGAGKDFLTDLLSYWLTSKEEFEIDEDNERVYTAGSAKVALQEYNGQECICFRDYRAGNLLEAFGGRGGVFGAFDTTPRKAAFNIKYGSITLKNKYSIINSVQTFEEFSNNLCQLSKAEIEAIHQETGYNPNAYNSQDNQDDENNEAEEEAKKRKGEKIYESKLQTLRRWAFIIHILDNAILIKINNNFLYPKSYQNEYTTYAMNGINLRYTIEEIKRNATTGTQEEIFKLTLEYFPCLIQYIKDALIVHSANRQPSKENSLLGQIAKNIYISSYQEYSTSNLNNNIVQDSEGEDTNGNQRGNTQRTAQESISIPDATPCGTVHERGELPKDEKQP